MQNKDNDKKMTKATGHSSSDDETGQGGKTGAIEFKDFLASGQYKRDDQLPPDKIKQLLASHSSTHEGVVRKQKDLMQQRQDVKNGKISVQAYRQGMSGANMRSEYKSHPVLSNKAQFSGMDPQVNTLPEEHNAKTNDDLRNELQLQYSLKYAPENAPKFNPKPKPY